MSALRLFLLMAGLVIAGVDAGHAQGKRVALVIGNAAYKETSSLANPRNDAADVAAALKRLSFEVLDGTDLDKREMERLIRRFDTALAGADLALFYYAGHGIQVAGQNHMVPVDARLGTEGDLDFETLPLNLVLRRMEREAKTSVVLLDACRDNPLAKNLARSMGTRSTAIGQGLAKVDTGIGTLISFSTQPGNVALDGDGRNSPYTAALLNQVEQPNRDLLSVLAAVRGDVVRATGGRQVPWEHTSLLGPLVLKSTEAAATAPVVTPAPAQPPSGAVAARTTASEAAEAWAAVKGASTPGPLEAFIRRYGDTFYGDLAAARLKELSERKQAAVLAAPPMSPPAAKPGGPESGAVSQALCGSALPFLIENGAFGAKPVRETAYADRVRYFHHGTISRADVMRVARDYERKFPERSYDIDQKTVAVKALPENLCQISFQYTFSVRNAQDARTGRGTAEFMLRRTAAAFEIITETGRALPQAAGAATAAASLPRGDTDPRACKIEDPTGSPLNVRRTPQGSVVTTLANDNTVLVQRLDRDGQGQEWALISRAGETTSLGWVFRKFVKCP